MPEAIAAQQLRAQPQVQQEQRPRMPEAHAPQQSRAERQDRRNDRGHKGSER